MTDNFKRTLDDSRDSKRGEGEGRRGNFALTLTTFPSPRPCTVC